MFVQQKSIIQKIPKVPFCVVCLKPFRQDAHRAGFYSVLNPPNEGDEAFAGFGHCHGVSGQSKVYKAL